MSGGLNKALPFKAAKFVPAFAFSALTGEGSGAEFEFLPADEPLPRQIVHTAGWGKTAARLSEPPESITPL